MNNEKANSLVGRLVGLSAWGVKIGPAGMHIHFGREIPGKFGAVVGQLSLWIQCRVRIFGPHQVIIDTDYPAPSAIQVCRDSLDQKQVTKASIDQRNSSLRLLFAEDILLSAFPEPKLVAKPWMIYDHSDLSAPSFVIFSDVTEEVED